MVDLCRIIAGPSINRSLAEMGASAMRVTGPGVLDLSSVYHDLNWESGTHTLIWIAPKTKKGSGS